MNLNKVFGLLGNGLVGVAITLLLSGCVGGPHKKDEPADSQEAEAHGRDEPNEGHSNHKGSANAYMRQNSVEDLVRRFESPERDAYQQPKKVLNYLGPLQGKKVMDLGAGSGYFSVKLAEGGAQVIAADVDQDFQEFLQKRIAEDQIANIETRMIPYDSPGLSSGEVDMVLMVNSYHHVENRPDYFAKVKAGTRSGGELVIIDYFKYEIPVGPPVDHKVSMDIVINELKQAGYSQFTVEVELLKYQFVIRAQ